MANNVEVAKPSLPHMASVERISKLPVVEQTVDLASSLYGRVKDASPLANTVLSTAETTVKGAVGKTLPVANCLEGPIKVVDTILCSSLDFVETNLPAVKLPPDEMYKNTKDYVFGLPGVNCACQLGQQGVRRAVACACAVSEYSTLKLNGLKHSLAVQDADKKEPDVRTLFSMYLYTLLHVLTVVSAWVGLGQGILKAQVETEKKPQTNGNAPANYPPTDRDPEGNNIEANSTDQEPEGDNVDVDSTDREPEGDNIEANSTDQEPEGDNVDVDSTDHTPEGSSDDVYVTDHTPEGSSDDVYVTDQAPEGSNDDVYSTDQAPEGSTEEECDEEQEHREPTPAENEGEQQQNHNQDQ